MMFLSKQAGAREITRLEQVTKVARVSLGNDSGTARRKERPAQVYTAEEWADIQAANEELSMRCSYRGEPPKKEPTAEQPKKKEPTAKLPKKEAKLPAAKKQRVTKKVARKKKKKENKPTYLTSSSEEDEDWMPFDYPKMYNMTKAWAETQTKCYSCKLQPCIMKTDARAVGWSTVEYGVFNGADQKDIFDKL